MTPYMLPCTDGSLSLLQVMEFHAKANPDHLLFRYDSPSTPEGYEDITWRQVVNLFDTTTQIIRGRLGAAVDRTPLLVVGILASTSSILYTFLLFGTLRAGCPVFPLSTRNSEAAIGYLITESGVNYLLVSQDTHMQDIARKANDILQSKNVYITLILIPTYEEISISDALRIYIVPQDHTSHPEVLQQNSRTTYTGLLWCTIQAGYSYYSCPDLVDLSARVQATHGAAMFRFLRYHHITLSPDSKCGHCHTGLSAHLRTVNQEHGDTVPTHHWAQDPASVKKLRMFTQIVFGGGSLTRSVGDALDRSGVTLTVTYRIIHIVMNPLAYSTEVGTILQPSSEAHGNGWEYFQFHPSLEPVLVPVDGDPTGSLFRLIVKQSETNCLVLPNTEVDGILAYNTNNILQRHPTAPTFYRVYRHADDQIMHSNGEKTNPGPIEQILVQDPRVKATIMFGHERPHAGVVIAPSQGVLDVEAPTVEQANTTTLSHSRLFKDMIVLATPLRPFQVTVKGARVHFSPTMPWKLCGARFTPMFGPASLTTRIYLMPGWTGGRIPEMVAQALPDDVVFTSPTIAQLASLVYGVGISASAVTDKPDTPFKNVPASILDNKDSTIVRLREPAVGEPPLILVHGVSTQAQWQQLHIQISLPSEALPHWAVGDPGRT
ncbi:hypothetical protein B0H14DRAFT_3672610 [Mycena olivaceomarginata]|nr:hypothetical protein B0H14DRAFT_3672610 [Mycena olivaceomarginata]